LHKLYQKKTVNCTKYKLYQKKKSGHFMHLDTQSHRCKCYLCICCSTV